MDSLLVDRAFDWTQVEDAARVVKSCIAPYGSNWASAKDTWHKYGQVGSPQVLYYLISKREGPSFELQGYLRLMMLDQAESFPSSTWVVDYCDPASYEAVVLAGQDIPGTILVKKRVRNPGGFALSWPTVTMTPSLAQYPYHFHGTREHTWLIVPRATAWSGHRGVLVG